MLSKCHVLNHCGTDSGSRKLLFGNGIILTITLGKFLDSTQITLPMIESNVMGHCDNVESLLVLTCKGHFVSIKTVPHI
jgi:hypothetical protein